MFKMRFQRFIYLCMSFALLIAPLPLVAIAQEISIGISELEIDTISQASDTRYIYLGQELSNIGDIISQLADLDEQRNSPLHELNEYMRNGFSCAEQNAIIETLAYAEFILEQNHKKLDSEVAEKIATDLNTVVVQLASGLLTVDPNRLTQRALRTLVVNENLDVVGKTTLYKHLHGKEGAHFQGHLKVGKSAKFKSNVKIKGGLSVTDLTVISCIDNLCVNDLSVTNAVIDNLTLSGALAFTDISVVDATVSGTLSVNDAVIDNLTLNGALAFTDISVVDATISGTLSVNDALIQNMTAADFSATDAVITDLTVTNCMTNLCVNDLSVTDISIGGTLSINDIVINNATVTNFSTTDAIIANATVTSFSAEDAAVGNLTVTNCMTSLCTNALSVIDETISGTLSVSDAIIQSATATSFSAADAVVGNLTVTNCMTSLCTNALSVIDETISGTLSVSDAIIQSATATSLSAADAVVGNLTVTNCMTSLCTNALSVIDETISGTLSVSDAIIQSATATSLSATDAVVGNLTVTNCMTNLCINALSVTDETVSGVLSVNDAIAQNMTITSLSATDAVMGNLTVTNCMTSLCINALSVTDETISGTLSVSDVVIQNCITNLCVDHLSVTDQVVQSFLRFEDLAGNYVGLQAQSSVPTSYTLSLPSTIPTANQVLSANATTPTNLQWTTQGGSVLPASSNMIYVAKYGNDTTGNGSFNAPYLTLAKAITIANTLSSATTPTSIIMLGGVYVEDNSLSPLTMTASNISIIGDSTNGVIISPNTPANNLLLATNTAHISNITLESSSPLATGMTFSAGSLSVLANIKVVNFLIGVNCAGGSPNSYGLNDCLFVNNGTALVNNNSFVECNNCTFFGVPSLSGPAANTGISASGSSGRLVVTGGVCGVCNTGVAISNGVVTTITAVSFRGNAFDIMQTGSSGLVVSGCTFELTNDPSDIDIQVSGVGANAEIIACEFDGRNSAGTPQATGLLVSDNAYVSINGSSISNYVTGIQVGLTTDTSSTILFASAVGISNSLTADILQQGSATLNFNTGSATGTNIMINDPTNVTLAFFDLGNSNALSIGSQTDQNTTLLLADTASSDTIGLSYLSSLYSTQAIGVENTTSNPTSLFAISNATVTLAAVTTDDVNSTAGIQLFSDAASPVGGTSALRGWTINKNAFASSPDCELAFSYQNSDILGQPVIAQYTVMQLDGVANLLELPADGTQIVFAGDTNLYRSSAGVLQTDDNFVVGTLTPGYVVVTDPVTNQLVSSPVTNTELAFLSGTTAPIQTQLNGKVSKTGDTMTGALQLPAGTTTAPSLLFTGSTTTGLSANAGSLSLSTNGAEAMKISSSGTVSIDGFTTAGVVHNDASGNLSSSLIVDADIAEATISNDKLATISSTDTPGTIVVRDSSGNFATNMITIDGAVANSTDVATKAYVDSTVSSGLVAHSPALVVSTTDIGSPPAGLQTIDTVTLAANDRVLLTGQNNPVENGLWLAQAGPGDWIRPADFETGTLAGQAYVLILSGAAYAGSSWLCNTPSAVIDADPIEFSLFALPNATTGANVGAGTGLIFQNKTGVTLNFRSLIAGTHTTITTNTNDITLSLDATNLNTPSTIVARDASGDFSATTITANLTGAASLNVLRAGDTMTGTLQLPAGTTALPSLVFTGSTTTGLSANSNILSLSSAGTECMRISPSGVISIDNLTTVGVVHNDASGDLSTSLIVNADIDSAAAIANSKLATLTTAGLVANSATTATSADTSNTIVLRDSSGGFSAGTIVASLTGAASLNVLKAGDTMTGTLQLPAGTNAAPALVFTGSTTSGLSASAGNLAINTSGVERITIASGGSIAINGFTAAGVVHNDASGNLSSSLIVDADISATAAIANSKLATLTMTGLVANSATTATNLNTASTIVARDASGNFSAGTITASLNGNATSATTATTATTTTNFTGSLTGDVTGTQSATVVSMVGGQTAANVASATVAANAATSTNTASTIVERDSSGDFSATTITANLNGNATTATTATTATNFTGSLSGDVTGTQSATVVSKVGGQTAANVALATIAANAATNVNTANTIVKRDGTGSFAAQEVSVNDIIAAGNLVLSTDPSTATAGNIVKGSTPFIHDYGTGSTFVGINAGNFTLTGSGNSGFGTSALAALGSGSNNTAVGNSALESVTSAIANTAVGYNALAANQTSSYNTAFGYTALGQTTMGSQNTAIGSGAMFDNIAGSYNTALGYNSLNANTTSLNTGIGYNVLPVNTTGTQNTAVGAQAMSFNTTGSNNIAMGYTALYTNVNGNNNIALGMGALFSNTTGSYNSAAGTNALGANTTGQYNTAVGYNALINNTTGVSNIAIGYQAGQTIINGTGNIYLGTDAATSSESNTTRIGNSQTTAYIAGITGVTPSGSPLLPVIINSNGQLGSLTLTPAGVVHNDASGNLSTSLIVNADISATAAIANGKLATLTTAGLVANSATTATNLDTASAIVARDASGNFVAGTITAALNGNATTATSATTATTATNFTGSLSGNVTGTQTATVVSTVGGQTAANVAAGVVLANAATNLNTDSAIVRRDASGDFSATTITAALSGNATTATTATNFTGSLSGNVTGTQTATVVSTVGGQTAANVAAGAVLANAATSLNTDNAIVRRDGTGSFAAQEVSVNDIIAAGNLVLSTDPSTATAGNIMKGSNSFIHDFGTDNTFVGIGAGNLTLTGTGNIGMGYGALQGVTSGTNNVALGYSTLNVNTTASQNTAIGSQAMAANSTGNSNTACGFTSLAGNTIGVANVAIGHQTLVTNTTGDYNTAVGAHALQGNSTGSLNTGIGFNSLMSVSNGVQNAAIGNDTLENLTTGSYNTALGHFAGQNASGASSNNIYINNIGAVESDTIRIGTSGTQTSCYIAGIYGVTVASASTVLMDSAGQLGTVSSTRRVKHDIEDMDCASENVLALRPVTFVYNADATNATQYGLIAEEVEELFPAIVVKNAEGKPETVQYHILPILLLNEMKKQQAVINEQNSVIDSLNTTIIGIHEAMKSLNEELQQFVARVKKIENNA